MLFAVGDVCIGGQISIVVQKQIELDGALGSAEFGSGEKAKAQGYGGAVKRQ